MALDCKEKMLLDILNNQGMMMAALSTLVQQLNHPLGKEAAAILHKRADDIIVHVTEQIAEAQKP